MTSMQTTGKPTELPRVDLSDLQSGICHPEATVTLLRELEDFRTKDVTDFDDREGK